MRQDLTYAVRSLARNPLFSTVAIVTVALGVGLNTSVFGIVNVLLFRPPLAENPHELVWLSSASTKPDGPRGNMTYPDVGDMRSLPVFRNVMAYAEVQANVASAGQAERLVGQVITGDYFQALGTRPHRGRLVSTEDDTPGNAVAVISFRLWQRLFAGRDEAVGANIHINGAAFTICGIAPSGFRGPDVFSTADVWVPIAASKPMNSAVSQPTARTSWWLRSIGRLAPGITQTEANAAVRARAASIAQAFPDSHDGFTVRLDRVGGVPPGDQNEVMPLAGMLLAATLTVLLIACANVANLLLVRGVAKGRETAIRVALGASRGRLIRQHLIESGLLAICGGALGLLFSMWSTELLLRFAGVPLEADLSPDRLVLAFTLGVSILTGILFGVAPALRGSTASPAGSLKSEQGSGDARPRTRLQSLLVTGQLAVSLILLVTASLFLKSLSAAWTVDVGFDPADRVSISFNLRMNGYTDERALAFQEALLERTRSVPGIRSATLAALVPLGGRVWVSDLTFPDRPSDPDARPNRVSVNRVWPDFFSTLGIPIVAGRALDTRDMGRQPTSAVINQTMARQHWPGRSPLGQRFSVDGASGPFVEVVGVARDTITDEFTERPWAAAYLPRQRNGDDAALIAHANIPAADALRALEAQVRALDSSVALFQPMTLRQHIAERLDGERALSRMLSVIGLLALTLAAIGLYGVIAYTVERRTREIGVRVALGARPRDVLRLFVGDAARLALIGVMAGLVPAIGVTALLAGSLVGVTVADPIALGGVMAVLTTVSLVAAYLPARRAALVDPLIALRRE
jgi:predicted permease